MVVYEVMERLWSVACPCLKIAVKCGWMPLCPQRYLAPCYQACNHSIGEVIRLPEKGL
jgi:hypothetical protein